MAGSGHSWCASHGDAGPSTGPSFPGSEVGLEPAAWWDTLRAGQPPSHPTFLCPQLPSTPERTTSQTRSPRHSTPDRPLDNRHSTGPGWGPALPTGTGQALAVTPFALGQAPRLAAPRFPGPSLHQAVRPTPAPWLRRCSGAWVTRARLPHRAQPAPSKFPQAGPPPAHLPLACPPRAPGPHPEPHPRSSSR